MNPNLKKYEYYREDNIVIYCGDCLKIMPELEDKSVDLVLTDPPYGININKKCKNYGIRTDISRKSTELEWDDNIPSKENFIAIFNVSKNQIVFGANYFWEMFYSSRCYIVWDKRGNLPKVPFVDTEFAWTSFDKMPQKYTHIVHGFIKDNKNDIYQHPTQKPINLMNDILIDFSIETDIILDPFMGSGTTLVAVKQLNRLSKIKRKCIGIEIEEKYCEIAKKRLQGYKNFDEPSEEAKKRWLI